MKKSASKLLLLTSLILISVLFIVCAGVSYSQFRKEFISNELLNQRKLTRIVNQSLNEYFDSIKFMIETVALDQEFSPEKTRNEDQSRYDSVPLNWAHSQIGDLKISKVLQSPRSAVESNFSFSKSPAYWQLFKGLPLISRSGKTLAEERRKLSRNVLRVVKDIHYVFEMDTNGDLVFLEPYEIQKNVSSFNYEFRDYLRLVKATKSTAISEGYISHDENRTQIITVATPIFGKSGEVAKIFDASVSAGTLRDRVFRSLSENMGVQDGTVFYLVDRHGHIVASSSGKNIYFPKDGRKGDEEDYGNLRSTGFFNLISWQPDILEKGNVWERETKSWSSNSLNDEFQGQYKNLNGEDVFATFFPTSIVGSAALNWGILIETPASRLVASEIYLNRVFLLAGCLLLLVLAALFVGVVRSFRKLHAEIDSKQKQLFEISEQVTHDIRSPLAALDMVVYDLSGLPEERRIIVRSAVGRIRDITNTLIEKHRPKAQWKNVSAKGAKELSSVQLIPALLDGLMTEIRTQYRMRLDVDIAFKMSTAGYGAFVLLQPDEFKRVISNLVNNSVESIESSGRVEVELLGLEKEVQIVVRDDGKGIPSEVLPTLMRRGVSYDKPDGTGLGLFHASQCAENWSGKIMLKSTPGHGTEVVLSVPRAPAPEWFVPQLELHGGSRVVVLDDDSSIHQIWEERFAEVIVSNSNIKVFHFTRANEVREWSRCTAGQTVYLFDYELIGDEHNGLELIEELGIQASSILVTSRFEEQSIRDICSRLGVRLIPKGMAGFVPIKVTKQKEKPDAILIDDDDLILRSWTMAAGQFGKRIKCYSTSSSFMMERHSFHLDTPIFIDCYLENGQRGERLAEQLHDEGFLEIHLATGQDIASIAQMPFLKSIVGKSAPWQDHVVAGS